MMELGIDLLLKNPDLLKRFKGRRLALLGHAASVTRDCRHSLDALMGQPELTICAAFGPQHGMRADKQDNMVETEDYLDPVHRIPVFSLYGEVRYPTESMLDRFDVLLMDLQDIGTRIYTYVTTLAYMLDACASRGKTVCILDRPNPVGRPIEGTILAPGWESFVGAAPMIMRHGLTLGELARWLVQVRGLDLDLLIVPMAGYRPEQGPGYGWPLNELSWVNPSPNASGLNMARCFPGTVLFEGTTLSEGRGTANPLELVGAPDIDFSRVMVRMASLRPDWLTGCRLRLCHFEPTFHKHVGSLCSGLQIHTDNAWYEHDRFSPYRLASLLLKAIRLEYPDYGIWRVFPYEYETERLAIDLLSGGAFLREWVEDPAAAPGDLDARLLADEAAWGQERADYLLYESR
jgi:uncharacterized protein YbbC (DUF1343 family)